MILPQARCCICGMLTQSDTIWVLRTFDDSGMSSQEEDFGNFADFSVFPRPLLKHTQWLFICQQANSVFLESSKARKTHHHKSRCPPQRHLLMRLEKWSPDNR